MSLNKAIGILYLRGAPKYAAYAQNTHIVHRVVTKCPDHLLVDHINRNGLDNRKVNLRFTTNAENLQNLELRKVNTSGHSGVCWHILKGRWEAGIKVGNKRIHIGSFTNIIDAVKAREEAVKKYHPYADPTTDLRKEAQIQN